MIILTRSTKKTLSKVASGECAMLTKRLTFFLIHNPLTMPSPCCPPT